MSLFFETKELLLPSETKIIYNMDDGPENNFITNLI